MSDEVFEKYEKLLIGQTKIESKVDSVILSMEQFRILTTNIETRLRVVEDVHTRVDPIRTAERIALLEAWSDSQKTVVRVAAAIWSVVALIGGIFGGEIIRRTFGNH